MRALELRPGANRRKNRAEKRGIFSSGDQMSSRTAVEVRLLGELELLHGGRVQPLPASKKTRALLAYLVATAKPHLRERLCALLWDGPDDPRAALRWSLTKIRPLLDVGAERLVADRERVAFEPGDTTVDATLLRDDLRGGVETASTDVLRRTAARFRGEFLEGLDLPSCYRFHEWCVGEREALRALRVRVLANLGTRLDTEPDEALHFARERVRVDPLTEAAHVDLVRLLGRLGRVREAQAQYETCRRILETELGARTSQALEQARMDLARPAAAPISAPTPVPETPARPVPDTGAAPGLALVGRVEARAAVEVGLHAARAGRASPVLLFVGDPGIGKTRLLDELAQQTRKAQGVVLRGRAFEAEMVRPYGPWIDAFRSSELGLVPPTLAAELAPLLPEMRGGDAGSISDGGDRARLFDAVARLLATLAAKGKPVALLLDDVQWLDEASAALLHYVARADQARHVALGCAARSGELGDNAAVLRVVRALEREQRLRQFPLGTLDAADTAALIQAAYPAVDSAAIFAASGGHPLYALEMARALAASAGPVPTATLDALIDERLDRLEGTARELVPWAAALGHSFAPDVLADVTATNSAVLLAALDVLERHGIVRPTGDAYDFAHDLLRQTAYRRLSEPRRRLVHLQIARTLHRTRGGDDTVSGEIAHHATLGGDPELAVRAYVAAGTRCVRLFAHGEAAELATRGLQQVHRLERNTRIGLHIALLHLIHDSGRAARRRPQLPGELTRLVMEAQDAGLAAEASRGFFVLSLIQFVGENFDAAKNSILRALDAARATDPLTAARSLADSARCLLMLERDVPRAEALIAEARAVLGPAADHLANLAWARGLMGRFCGQEAPAREAFDQALDGYRRDQANWEVYQLLAMQVMLHLETGQAGAALERSIALREVADRMPEGSEPVVASTLGALARLALREAGAEAACEVAIAALRAADAKAMLAYALGWCAEHALGDGRLDVAERRAGEALTVAALVDRRSELAVARALLGRIALARHDRQSAEAHLTATREDRERPLGLSARALTRLSALETALESLPVTAPPTRRRSTAPS
jgi:DNA-binding SARP family transcriptional activator